MRTEHRGPELYLWEWEEWTERGRVGEKDSATKYKKIKINPKYLIKMVVGIWQQNT